MVTMLVVITPSAFADHSEVSIITVDESGFSQTCAESQGGSGCYGPMTATVDVGGVVTMINTDPTGVHTFTSGTVDGFSPSPSGIFDSSVLMSGDAFEWIPTQAGEVPYYCMLHTWMIGTIIVQESESIVEQTVDTIINIPNDVTVDAEDQHGATFDYSVSATYGGTSIGVSCDYTPVIPFPIGVTEVICTASNGIQSTFSVTVIDVISIQAEEAERKTQQEAKEQARAERAEIQAAREQAKAEARAERAEIQEAREQAKADARAERAAIQEAKAEARAERAAIQEAKEQAKADARAEAVAYAKAVARAEAAAQAASKLIPIDTNIITTVIGSSNAYSGCEIDGCYIPSTAGVNVGDVITFANTDNVSHTFTSGSPGDDVIGTEFNTGLLLPGDLDEWIPKNIGKLNYFCMIHPWMQGNIVVNESNTVSLENIKQVPSWVKNVFGWYATGQVAETELMSAIKYLIDEKIITLN